MYGVILHAHPVRGESHNQRNTTGEVATRPPLLPIVGYSAWFAIGLLSLLCDYLISIVAIGNPERHERKASHCGSKQQ